MLFERLEVLVRLGKGVGLFARGGAYLHRRLDAKLSQHIGELLVRHQVFFVRYARGVQQCLLAITHVLQMLTQVRAI